MDLKDCNETELLGIRRALTLWTSFGQGKLNIEEDSTNAIKWAKELKRPPWKLILVIIREIRALCFSLEVPFEDQPMERRTSSHRME